MSSISVIIPTYNCASYLAAAVESICNQTLKPQEIIIVDDGSSDETEMVVNTFTEFCPLPIRYFYQENQGPSVARNVGIQNAQGEFIAFLDADDLWLPLKLELQLNYLRANPGYGMVGCGCFIIASNLQILEQRQGIKVTDHDAFMRQLAIKNVMGSPSGVLIRSACFKKVGFFDESIRTSEDWDMWFRIGSQWLVGILSEPLVKIRICLGSNSSSENINHLRVDSMKVLNRIYTTDPWKSRNGLKKIAYSDRIYWHAVDYMNLGKRFTSFNLIMRSFFYNPIYFLRSYQRTIPTLIRILSGDRAYRYCRKAFGRKETNGV